MMLLDLVDACWTTWQTAMEEGTVADWVVRRLSPDVVVTDYIGKGGVAKAIVGHDGVCRYYNAVLAKGWGGGCSLTWGLEGAVVVAPYIVRIVFNLHVAPAKENHVTRQVWTCRVDPTMQRIQEVVITPLAEIAPPSPSGLGPRRCSTSTACSHGSYCASSEGSSRVSPPSPQSGLLPPCTHNSWENVRIKRGWAVLRCRECTAQWRLRPSDIDRCQEFGKEIGRTCPLGNTCPKLHIHFTRLRREAVLQQRQLAKQMKNQVHYPLAM